MNANYTDFPLTHREIELIRNFRKINDSGQEMFFKHAESSSRCDVLGREKKPAPALQLVKGGA